MWTKAGQILEFGSTGQSDDSNATISPVGSTVAAVWAVRRISDVIGNYIDFKYDLSPAAWGTGSVAGSPQTGQEWNISEIQYGGNKVVFAYENRPAQTPSDSSESYHGGFKNVSIRRLKSITTYVNSNNVAVRGPAASAVAAKTYKLGYASSAITKRSLLQQVQECAGGPASSVCFPPTRFDYSAGRDERLALSTAFAGGAAATTRLTSTDGKYGVLVADFNGDGKSDLLRWSETASENQLWLSNGDGSFTLQTNGTASGQFNLGGASGVQLFRSDGCYASVIQDVNGDGLPDIVRLPASVSNAGGACGVPMQAVIYANGGDGRFTARTVVDTNGTPIVLDRIISQKRTQTYCGNIAALDSDSESMGEIIMVALLSCRTGVGWTAGATYYFIDFDGDGLLDLVVSNLAALAPEDPGNFPITPGVSSVACSGCTKVYRATASGSFALVASSNLNNVSVYSDPGIGSDIAGFRKVLDMDLDGLPDLVGVGTTVKKQSWLSLGDGNFASITSTSSCDVQLDFNGDGKADCLLPAASAASNTLSVATGASTYAFAANFNLVNATQELSSANTLPAGSNFGISIADLDGDHRHDILRWHDDKTKNAVYLSNGDGTFRQSTAVFASTGPVQLRHTNGSYDYVAGDFTGRGFFEILRMSDVAPSTTNAGDRNLLLVSGSTNSPDEDADTLRQITSSSGLVTRLTRQRLTSALGARYTSDRNTSYQAALPKVDMVAAMPVVVTVEADTGVGSATVKTEYAFRGLKADVSGRGMLGFREFRQQSVTPNNSLITTVTQSLQDFPFIGETAAARSYIGALLDDSVPLLTRSTFSYCDTASSATPVAVIPTGTPPVPCLAHAAGALPPFIYRPYLYQKVEEAWDLNRGAQDSPLTKTTSTFSYDSYGNAQNIVTTTTGTSVGLQQTYTQTTANEYKLADTAGDNWIIGRLQKATVTNSVPGTMPATSSGASPHATDRTGSGPPPAPAPLPPGVLNAILQLLLLSD